MKTCFIVSQIGDKDSDIRKHADKLFKHVLAPVCKECGLEAVRVDQMNDVDSINQTIIDKLNTSELVIADMTGHNPNVFYEIGYRRCTGKPIIHLRDKKETIPFDVNSIRTFDYDLTDLDSVDEIKERLVKTINQLSLENNEDKNTLASNDNGVGDILTTLYQIQDSVNELRKDINKKDTEMIQSIMQTSINNALKPESESTVLMKTLLPEIMRNPNALNNLLKMVEFAEAHKK